MSMPVQLRFKHAELLAEQYADFKDFAADAMRFLGFSLTPIQEDIAEYMQSGPRLRMVMAQRGEAKSTLACLYAVWRLIQRPSTRVLVVSAGEDQALEDATLIVRCIMTWDILTCLRPDKQQGDRTSVTAFDVHYALKGLDKSPSIACVGITSNLPGKRADLLIADDVESNRNGLSATQRQQLLQATKEFSSICTHGDILYLGTPQSKDSIYNTLPQRGFDIRIWPGRYPTEEEESRYNGRLAPCIVKAMQENPALRTGGGIDGSRGQPTDPLRYTDEELIEKELDKGPEDFQLQYMLDTSLVDAVRLQLKLSDLVVANFGADTLPEIVAWQAAAKYEVTLGPDFPVPGAKMYYAAPSESAFVRPKDICMYIDPAGGGADEIGFAVATSVGPYVHVLDAGGLKGGLTPENEQELVEVAKRNNVTRIKVESNMGHGLFETHLRAIFNKHGMPELASNIKGEYSTGQKERRIIDSLVSSMQRHRVIVHQQVFASDAKYLKQHSLDQRAQYSLWYQMANITTDRNSLPHDDRLEAFAGAVREFKAVLDQDEHKAAEMRKQQELQRFLQDPMGYGLEVQRTSGTRALLKRQGNRPSPVRARLWR